MTDVYVDVRSPQVLPGEVAAGPTVAERLACRIDEISDSLKEVALGLSKRLDELAASANNRWELGEVELKFALELEAEAGVVITKASTTATFEATLKWSRCQTNSATDAMASNSDS